MVQLVSELAAKVVEYFPLTQSRQVEMDVAPDSGENVPEPHERQLMFETAASSFEYDPTRPKKMY